MARHQAPVRIALLVALVIGATWVAPGRAAEEPRFWLSVSWTRPGESGVVHRQPEALRMGDTLRIAPRSEGFLLRACTMDLAAPYSDAYLWATAEINPGDGPDCPAWSLVVPRSQPGSYVIRASAWGTSGTLDVDLSTPDRSLTLEAGGTSIPFASNYPVSSWAPEDLLGSGTMSFGSPLTLDAPAVATEYCGFGIVGRDYPLHMATRTADCSDWDITLPDTRPDILRSGPLARPAKVYISVGGSTQEATTNVRLSGSTRSHEFPIHPGAEPDAFASNLPALAFLTGSNPTYAYPGEISVSATVMGVTTGTCQYGWNDGTSPNGDGYGWSTPVVDGACPPLTYSTTEPRLLQYGVGISISNANGTTETLASASGRVEFVDALPAPALEVPLTTDEGEPTQFLGSVSTGAPIAYSFSVAHSDGEVTAASTATAAQCDQASGSLDPTKELPQRSAHTTCEMAEPGDYLVTATFRDVLGRVRSRTRSFTVLPDTTPPLVTAPTSRIATGPLPVDGVRARISWTGSDLGSGLEHYELQQSLDGGSFLSPGWSLRVPRRDITLRVGHSYRFRVRAIDHAGQVGTWKAGPTFIVRGREESSPAVSYRGTWTSLTRDWASGGTVRSSSSAGASATMVFDGRAVAWLGSRGPAHGKARVYLDGNLAATVDLDASSFEPGYVAFQRSWSTVGRHALRVEVVGGGRVDYDAIFTFV